MEHAKQRLRQAYQSLSFGGLILASLFFAASVTPSLIPRHYLTQGILSGFALAIGYAIGVFSREAWFFWGLRNPNSTVLPWLKRGSIACAVCTCGSSLWRMGQWQNSVRLQMEMAPIESAYRIRMILIAIIVAIALLAAGRAMKWWCLRVANRLGRYMPVRIASTLSVLLVAGSLVFVTNGLVARGILELADAGFRRANQWVDQGVAQPEGDLLCGGPHSLVQWNQIGRFGKSFLTMGPSKEAIESYATEISGMQNAVDSERKADFERKALCQQPIRVYASMQNRGDETRTAQLAVAELDRIGGFDRSLLIVATPTGTGWLQPEAVDSIEYLHFGDTAIVSTQYSYLPSWLTLLVDPERARRAAKALFREVYDHWKTLPQDDRPRLYLHGLSLGAYGSEVSADLMMVFEDPIDGALWSGAPFPSTQWQSITMDRKEGTPPWLPEFRDGRIVRFMNRTTRFDQDQPWGQIKNLYLQHPSDPMIWFSPSLAWHRPDWLEHPRGDDVADELTWYPVVTFLQVAFDLPMATSVPHGYGHNYSASEYVRGWHEITRPKTHEGKNFKREFVEILVDRLTPSE